MRLGFKIFMTMPLQFILIAQALFAGESKSLGIRPTAFIGLLQQPSSQYYHLMYGGSLDLQVYNSWVIRANYLERPKFVSAGYSDQDFVAFADTGATFFKRSVFAIHGFLGAGQSWGYIKEVTDDSEVKRRNGYRLDILSCSMEASLTSVLGELRIGHSLHTGRGDKNQTEAKVVWPLTTYYLSLSRQVGTFL